MLPSASPGQGWDPWLGMLQRAQPGSIRLELEPPPALPWGTTSIGQSCEGTEWSRRALTSLQHHLREAKAPGWVHSTHRVPPLLVWNGMRVVQWGSDALLGVSRAFCAFPKESVPHTGIKPLGRHLVKVSAFGRSWKWEARRKAPRAPFQPGTEVLQLHCCAPFPLFPLTKR